MSTRSAIARVAGDGWVGVYVHFDGYPSGRGPELWRALHERFGGDAEALCRYFIDQHPQGWSSLDEPHASEVSGTVEEHGRCSESCTPLFIEWVYAFSERQLTVLASQECSSEEGHPFDATRGYRHVIAGSFPLDGDEPDWDALEKAEEDVYAAAHPEGAWRRV